VRDIIIRKEFENFTKFDVKMREKEEIMAVSIVKVPSDDALGLDFLAFSFNGKHSWDDFGIYRVSDGNRYNENLSPTLTDKTAEVPGGDGMYYFGTYHK
jgi:hypothetical protein